MGIRPLIGKQDSDALPGKKRSRVVPPVMTERKPIRFALPKGRLQKNTAAAFAAAGIELEDYDEGSKTYRARILGYENVAVKLLKPQEIPILVSRGAYDLGISGLDWYVETRCERNVEPLVDLNFGRVDIVLAVPNSFTDVNSADDLFAKYRGTGAKDALRIWTEYLNLADQLVLKYEGVEASIVSPLPVQRDRHSSIAICHSFGATESKPPEDGEAIIDNTETGTTLRANDLKIIHKVLAGSTAHLLANRRSLLDPGKQERIENIRAKFAESVAGVVDRRRKTVGHLDW
jgi:ATP phosphoribosyltransferase